MSSSSYTLEALKRLAEAYEKMLDSRNEIRSEISYWLSRAGRVRKKHFLEIEKVLIPGKRNNRRKCIVCLK